MKLQKEDDAARVQYDRLYILNMMEYGEEYLFYSQYCPSLYASTEELDLDILFRANVGDTGADFDRAVASAVVGCVSMWASALVAYIILTHKKLGGHYNKLIAYLCILNLMSSYHVLLYAGKLHDTVCYFGLA